MLPDTHSPARAARGHHGLIYLPHGVGRERAAGQQGKVEGGHVRNFLSIVNLVGKAHDIHDTRTTHVPHTTNNLV